jgi:transposase
MRLNPGHIFMQDGAPGHAAKETLQDLLERGIRKMNWPPFSPDLNPIETVWDWMKEWIWNNY